MKLDTITLPDELRWVDEFSWSKTVSSKERTIQGRLIIYDQTLTSDVGRPITLFSDYAWTQRTTVEQLYALAQTPQDMVLTLNDLSQHRVRFRHWDEGFYEVTPVVETAFPDDATYYNIGLKFVVIGSV